MLHINRLQKADDANIMMLDKSTKRNLELTQPMMGSGKKGTLFGVLDKTRTAQGSRLLKRWIEQPLQNAQAIEHRQNAVACFFEHFGLLNRFGIVWTRYTIWNAFAARSRIRR